MKKLSGSVRHENEVAYGGLFPVVGVAASSGGVESFSRLLTYLPINTGMAFVFVPPRSAQPAGVLASLFAGATPMPVCKAASRTIVRPNHVYVIPPDRPMRIVDSVLAIAPRSEASPARQPIDYFFRSLAADRRAMGIGVMLTPADKNGVTGLQAIREKGGIAIVQNENSAGRATPGIADLILSPEEIGDALERIGRTADVSCDMPSRDARNLPDRILEVVKAARAVDFSFDRRDAVRRCILRRMKLRHCESMDGYLTYLESSSSETGRLAEDLLLHATGSFRDADALASLGEMLSRQLQAHPRDAPFRVWAPGCSTGQAVYSIAMCLLEAIPAAGGPVPLEIFGTDLSESAIATARAAVYADADVARLSPERRERFFTSFGGNFRIVESLREMCVFSQRHTASDHVFPPLDLISCRDPIAGLETPARHEIVATFHRALRPGGCVLLLGNSDSLGAFPELFQQIDKHGRLYAKRDCPPTGIRIVHSVETLFKTELDSAVKRIVGCGSAWVLVDGGLNIIDRHGDLSPYLHPGPAGEGLGLLNVFRDEIREELTLLLGRTRDGRVDSAPAQETKAAGGGKRLAIHRISASLANGDACYLIAFSRANHPGEPADDDLNTRLNTRLRNRNRELSRRNDDLVNLMGGASIPVLLVDRELRIKCMTPAAERLFHLPPGDAGRTIGDLPLLASEDLVLRIRDVIDSGTPEEIELPDRHGRFYLLRVQPSRNGDDSGDGAVLTLLDIGELRQARSAAVLARGFAEAIVETVPTPLLVLDSDLKVRMANGAFLAACALQPGDVQNRRIDEIDKGQWGTPEFKGAVQRLLSGETAFEEFEFLQNSGAAKRAVLINARRVVWQGSARILIAIHDIAAHGRETLTAREKARLERSARKTAAALHETEDALRQSRAELRALTGSLLHAQEEERRRVSRELHDDVSQDVVKLQFDIEALEQALPADRTTEKRGLMAVRDDAARLSNDLRRIAYVLHPSTLDNLGLTGALSGYASDFSRRTGIPVEFTASGVPETIPQGIASAFYRITQEALRNVVRHSGAASLIRLTGEDSHLTLAIHDNGPGFDRQSVRGQGGLGLVSMEERARLIGASFQLDTAAGEGVTITLSAPLAGAD